MRIGINHAIQFEPNSMAKIANTILKRIPFEKNYNDLDTEYVDKIKNVLWNS